MWHRYTRVFRKRIGANSSRPPITIIKPLLGTTPELRANLESFMTINYPHVRISAYNST